MSTTRRRDAIPSVSVARRERGGWAYRVVDPAGRVVEGAARNQAKAWELAHQEAARMGYERVRRAA